jgi:putative sterol carrier protein
MSPVSYLSEEWRAEAERRLKAELKPEQMNKVTTSMSNVYLDCPGGGTKNLVFRFQDGILTELVLGTGEPAAAEFHLTGTYDVMSKILRGEIPAQKALLGGQVKLKGNMLKALQLAGAAERVNKVLARIPTEY